MSYNQSEFQSGANQNRDDLSTHTGRNKTGDEGDNRGFKTGVPRLPARVHVYLLPRGSAEPHDGHTHIPEKQYVVVLRDDYLCVVPTTISWSHDGMQISVNAEPININDRKRARAISPAN